MTRINPLFAVAFVLVISEALTANAFGFTPSFSGSSSPSYTSTSASAGDIDFGRSSVHRSRSARRKIKAGGLMLGIGWAVPAVIGLAVMDFGDTAMGARMLIPYYGLSEAGAKVADETIFFAVPMFFPSIVQAVGTGLLIAGLANRNNRRFYASPVLYREGGAGVGVSFAM